MNKKDLDILLNKFYHGETSLDEEQLLRQALEGDDADALLMQALDEMEDEVEVPSDLEAALSGKIDEWEAQDNRKTEEKSKAKVAPLFWKRTAWAAAASLVVIAAIGWWFMRNGVSQKTGNNHPVIIAKTVEDPAKTPSSPIVEPENDDVLPAQQSQPQHKPKSLPQVKSASAYKNNVEHLAQVKVKPQEEPELTVSDEEIAIAALEKFSTILNKGMDQLDNANEKINDINNTIQQHLI